ncbi:MAG: hypothetical protein ACI909_003556 [Planctomycetota bacterium]|jgi:hypothetical protein
MTVRDDDLDWWETLGGDLSGKATPSTRLEADELGRIIESERPLLQPGPRAEELERILFDMRRQGLLTKPVTNRSRNSRWLAIAATPLLAVFAIGVFMKSQPVFEEQYVQQPVKFKSFVMPQIVNGTDREIALKEFLDVLSEHQVAFELSEAEEQTTLKILASPPVADSVSALFQKYQLRPTPNGELLVKFN